MTRVLVYVMTRTKTGAVRTSILLVSASKTDGLSDVHRRLIQRVLFTEKMWSQEKARAKRKNGLSDARAKQAVSVLGKTLTYKKEKSYPLTRNGLQTTVARAPKQHPY